MIGLGGLRDARNINLLSSASCNSRAGDRMGISAPDAKPKRRALARGASSHCLPAIRLFCARDMKLTPRERPNTRPSGLKGQFITKVKMARESSHGAIEACALLAAQGCVSGWGGVLSQMWWHHSSCEQVSQGAANVGG